MAPVVVTVGVVDGVTVVPAADAVDVFSTAAPGREQAAAMAAAMKQRRIEEDIGVAVGRASRVIVPRKLRVV
jgi:hypothetical protein